MSYLKKLNELLGEKPKFEVHKVDNVFKAVTVINGKKFIGFEESIPEAIETAARIAVDYIDPNNWVDDVVWG